MRQLEERQQKKGQRQSLKPLKRDVREKKTAAQATERANEARAAAIQVKANHLEKQNAKEAASKSFELTRANHEKKQRDLEAAEEVVEVAKLATSVAQTTVAEAREKMAVAEGNLEAARKASEARESRCHPCSRRC